MRPKNLFFFKQPGYSQVTLILNFMSMKTILPLVTGFLLCMAIQESALGQTRQPNTRGLKPRGKDTSLAGYKQRMRLKLTDTTGMGIGSTGSVDTLGGNLNFRPNTPALPPQNNPNHYNPSPNLSSPNITTDTTSQGLKSRSGKKYTPPSRP